MQANDFKTISIRIAPKEDFLLKEIFTRVCEKKRSEFIKEAIFYWDYILHHSNIGTRCLKTDKNKKKVIENLFPQSYYIQRDDPDMTIKERFENVEVKPIRFTISPDEVELQEICSRAVNLDKFIEEAIFEWDCLINTSNIFLSRFIKRKEDCTPEWHTPTSSENEYKNEGDNDKVLIENQSKVDTSLKDEEENKNVEPTVSKKIEEPKIEPTINIPSTAQVETTSTVGFSNGIIF